MIDFTTLQGLTIPEGVVTQITDVSGNVIWAVQSESDEPIVLEVEKITSDTYAGETTYTGESFILLDIYPKTASSKVKVTYGGLTKTLTFSGTNAQQVFFGTFNGVADEVETPASGTLTIEGGCSGFGCSKFAYSSKYSGYKCPCITAVTSWGAITEILSNAFYGCTKLALTSLPSGITGIGEYAFRGCIGISVGEIPEGVAEIGHYAFFMNSANNMPNEIILPSTVKYIGDYAFAQQPTSLNTFITLADIIIIRATEPPLLGGTNTFGEDNEATTSSDYYRPDMIVVPAGCGEAYRAAEYWSEHANKIVEAT